MKTAIVTGASTGNWKSSRPRTCSAWLSGNSCCKKPTSINETKRTIEQNNGKAEIFTTDLASVDSVNKLITAITSKYTEIHLIANIAGIWHGSDEVYAGKDFEDFDQNIILNTLPSWNNYANTLNTRLTPHMKACRW